VVVPVHTRFQCPWPTLTTRSRSSLVELRIVGAEMLLRVDLRKLAGSSVRRHMIAFCCRVEEMGFRRLHLPVADPSQEELPSISRKIHWLKELVKVDHNNKNT